MSVCSRKDKSCPPLVRIKLADIKLGSWKPNVPSVRRVSMDDQLGMLPDEHCISTVVVPTGVKIFNKNQYYHFDPPTTSSLGFDILPLCHLDWCRDRERHALSFLTNPELKDKWQDFVDYLPVAEKRIIDIPNPRSLKFYNYSLRLERPGVKPSWRRMLTGQPSLDGTGRIQPLPADYGSMFRPES